MRFITILAAVTLATPQTPGQNVGNSLCDKYTNILLRENNEVNQLRLLAALVNRVIIGNITATSHGRSVPGILARATFKGQEVNMLPQFNGELATANVNGIPTRKNFLDSGGAEPLAQGRTANAANSNQALLMVHLYGVFGNLLGCSRQGGTTFPAYRGNPSMSEVHKFMNISLNTFEYFLNQVKESALSFGVSPEDADAIERSLDTMFGSQCSAPTSLGNNLPAAPQGFCFGDGCAAKRANPPDQNACPNGRLPAEVGPSATASNSFKAIPCISSLISVFFVYNIL